MNSLAKTTREILEGKPYFKYALESGVANYSAMAGFIQPAVEQSLGRRRV